jgi:hypothetical protein
MSVKAVEYYGCSNKDQDERPKDLGEQGDELIHHEEKSDYYDEQTSEYAAPMVARCEHFIPMSSAASFNLHD